MPSLQRRRGRRGAGWVLSLATALSLVGLAAPSHATGDDYPYAGLGTCPLVPLHHHHAHTGTPAPSSPPHGGGHAGGPVGKPAPHHPGAQPTSQQPGSPAATKPAPPRRCAKNIWLYDGSYGDPWGFALRNCTSFVAWRLRETNGLADFSGSFGGVSWGDASNWDQAAAALGYLVDGVPAVGAVAQTDAGAHGHVAWVEAVGNGTVTVEEYNLEVAGGYDVRTVATSAFRYLHLDDVSPAPYLGSTRAGSTTTDAHGGTWSAQTTAGGRLVVRRPSGHLTRIGTPGGWSGSAPALVTDGRGRVWVAAATAGGRVLTTHTGLGVAAFSRPRPVLRTATTASPALAVDGDGRVRVLATGAGGTLLERHTSGGQGLRWSRPHRLGRPASWSVQAAPTAVTDDHGRVWVAAVTRRGALLVQHSAGGSGWSGFRAVARHGASTTSTPALAPAGGRVWLAGVSRSGRLVVRHTSGASRWSHAHAWPGRWSPYSSPALATDPTGRAWLAAVDVHGRLHVRSTRSDGSHWQVSRGLPRAPRSELASPALTVTVDGVLVGVRDGSDRIAWRLPTGPSGQPTGGPRGGGFWVSRYL